MADEESGVRKVRPLRPVLNFERHWRWGLLVAAIAFVLGLPLVWVKGQSQFAAEGVFQVFPTYQKNLQIDKELEIQSNSQYRDFVTQMMRTIIRRDIVEAMINDLTAKGVELCRPSERFRRCVERMQRLIYVMPVADSYMVKVGFVASEKGLADQVVNALLDEFIQKVRTEQIYGADERSTFLFEKRDALRKEVKDLEKSRNSLAQDLGLTTFNDSTSNPYDQLLQQARERHAVSQSELSAARSAQRAFREKGELPPSQGRSLLEMRYQDSGLQTMRSEVIKRQEEILKEIAGLRESHPMHAPLAEQKGSMVFRLKSEEDKVQLDIVRSAAARLAAANIQAELVEQDLKSKVMALEDKAEWFAAKFRKAQSLTREISLREKELDEIRDRMRYLESESRAVGFVRVIAKALPADLPTGPGKSMLLVGLLFFCLGLFMAVPIAVGWLDRRVTDVVDVERALKMPAAGWFVDMVSPTTKAIFSDQIRQLSASIVRRHRVNRTQVFGLSSVRIGGGVSCLSLELCKDLVKLGYSVTHVKQSASGLREGQADSDADADNLAKGHFAGPGPDAVESAGLHTVFAMLDPIDRRFDIGAFRNLINDCKNATDFVFVEMPPLMSSPNIDLIVNAVEDLVVVVEAMYIRKAELLKLDEKLTRISPASVAVLVNKIPLEHVDIAVKRQFIERSSARRHEEEMFDSRMILMVIRARISLGLVRIKEQFKNARFLRRK